MVVRMADAVVSVHASLDEAGLPHAFGGALALAYCIRDPRATKDVDVNVFVGPDRADDALDALPSGATVTRADRATAARDGQVRIWWDDTPIDVFLNNHWFHGRAEARSRTVPFGDVPDLPVLACEDLAVFKTFFGRPKDIIDVAHMVAASTVDLDDLEAMVDRLLGNERAQFLADVRRFASEI